MNDWKTELDDFFAKRVRAGQTDQGSELERFISDVVIPAFSELAEELEKHGREVTIRNSLTAASLIVYNKGEEELVYRIQGRGLASRGVPYVEVRFRERKGLRLIRMETQFRPAGSPDYSMSDISKEEVIKNFLHHYMRHVRLD
ncbi:MAG: hypothetical protein ACUVWX_04685 [Kiritimatiellia bacterium]